MESNGAFVVVYDLSIGDVTPGEIHARFYAPDGSFSTETVLSPNNQLAFNEYMAPSVALDGAGNPVITFVNLTGFDFSSSPALFGIGIGDVVFTRLTQSGGVLDSLPVTVSTPTTQPLSRPTIAADHAGNFVVTWNANTGSGGEIVFRRFDANGNALDSAPVDVSTTSISSSPSVGKAADSGAFVISWDDQDTTTVKAQRFDAAGNALGPIFQANTAPLPALQQTSVSVAEGGDFVITWTTGLSTSVSARVYNADGSPESPILKINATTADTGSVDVAVDRFLRQFVVGWAATPANDPETPLVIARVYRLPDKPPDQPHTPELPFIIFDQSTPAASPARLIFLAPPPIPTSDSFVKVTPAELRTSSMTQLSGSQRDERLGEISGRVFLDLNGNGIQDEGEPGLAGQRVVLDLNDNGIQDEDEPGMDTDANGRYLFSGLELNRYRVRQNLRPTRVAQTTPERNQPHVVELSWGNSSVSDKDFGVKVLQLTPVTRHTESSAPPLPTSTGTPPVPASTATPPVPEVPPSAP
jgi:hypothetical protein